MSFTKLEIVPFLDALFDKCRKDRAAVPQSMMAARDVSRLKSVCMEAAKKEINRQGAIYTAEELAYVDKIKRMHQEAKVLSFTVVDYTQKLAQNWNDQMFAEMEPKVVYIGKLSELAHAEAGAATAHQGWRGSAWTNDAVAEAAVDKDGMAELDALYKSHRQPMVDATADLKTFIVKLDEFHKRAIDSLKTAAASKNRAFVNFAEYKEEVKELVKDALKAKQDTEAKYKSSQSVLQKFIVLCNTRKTKLDDKDVKAAFGYQSAFEIFVKNNKTSTKTLEVKHGNLVIRLNKSVIPSQLDQMKGALAEAARVLQDARKALDSFSADLKTHQSKLDEAKSRK